MQTTATATAAAAADDDATQLNTPFSRIPGPVTALASAKSLQSSTGKRQTLFTSYVYAPPTLCILIITPYGSTYNSTDCTYNHAPH